MAIFVSLYRLAIRECENSLCAKHNSTSNCGREAPLARTVSVFRRRIMDEEILSFGEDFSPDMGGDDGSSVAVFESLIIDLNALESNNAFTDQELLILSTLESITSTIDFHKLVKQDVITLEGIKNLYAKLTNDGVENTTVNGNESLDVIFSKMLRLNPLRTDVNFL